MKKGFTLIEILVVICIIGVLSATSFISFAKINEKTTEQDYNNVVTSFITSAEVYIDNDENLRKIVYNDKGSVKVTLQDLYSKGFIKPNEKNPLTKKEFNSNSYITIKYTDKLVSEFNIIE